MTFDLDAVIGKKRYVHLNGRDVELLDLKTKDYLVAQAILEDMQDLPMVHPDKTRVEVADILSDMMVKYLVMILDIDEEEAAKMDRRQFKALREYLDELELKDQGFSPKEIEAMKKRALKNQVAAAIGS